MRSQSRLAEVLVLTLGILSSLGILWAALRTWGDPAELARNELSSSTERAAQLVQLTWERQSRLPEVPGGGAMWSATEGDLVATSIEPFNLGPESGMESALANKLRQAGALSDLDGALASLAEFPKANNRADGWLLVVQLAAAADRREIALDALSTAWSEIGPGQTKLDVPYLVLIALAAARVLNPEELADQQVRLLGHWQAGVLRLPESKDVWIEAEERALLDARFEVWARSIESLSPVHKEEVEAMVRRKGREFRALYQFLGSPELPREVGQWTRLGAGGREWLGRRSGEGDLFLAKVTHQQLLREVEREAGLGTGFGLLGEGDPSTRSVQIAGRAQALFQPKLEQLVEREASKQRTLKVGFGLLIIFVLGATLSTFSALVQRRKLDGLKSHFIAGVSHDLRTPLASILLMAENLESGRVQDPERQGQYHASIRREATRLGRLVDDVLDFSRLERGEAPKLAQEEVELESFVGLLAAECQERVDQVGGKLHLDAGDLPRTSHFDSGAMRRVVCNLLDNALAHSGSTSIEIAIRATEGELLFEVADHGTGIPAADQEALFEAFAQGRNRAQAAGGTGLGLAIVRELARAHGGDARFVNAMHRGKNRGTRVRVAIPRTLDRKTP